MSGDRREQFLTWRFGVLLTIGIVHLALIARVHFIHRRWPFMAWPLSVVGLLWGMFAFVIGGMALASDWIHNCRLTDGCTWRRRCGIQVVWSSRQGAAGELRPFDGQERPETYAGVFERWATELERIFSRRCSGRGGAPTVVRCGWRQVSAGSSAGCSLPRRTASPRVSAGFRIGSAVSRGVMRSCAPRGASSVGNSPASDTVSVELLRRAV
jgi:hypothetical protein